MTRWYVENKCHVVDVGCDGICGPPVRTVCYACGESVCKSCSRMRPWNKRPNVRVCLTCHEDDARFEKARAVVRRAALGKKG